MIARADFAHRSLAALALALLAPACSDPAPVGPTPVVPTTPSATATTTATPTAVPSSTAAPSSTASPAASRPLREAIDVGAGAKHACALLQNTNVVCWGKNDRGQLGNGGDADSAVAVVVPGLGAVRELAMASDFACVRHSDGGVSCWGAGASKPARVNGVTDATALALADSKMACAVLGDATARCWSMADLSKPAVEPVAGLRDVVQLAPGGDHSCAVLKDGTVRCWGDDCAGQLGDGARKVQSKPTAVKELPRAIGIAVAPARSCAILPNHAVACWGSQGYVCPAAAAQKADVCVAAGEQPGCGPIAGLTPRVFRGLVHVASFGKGRLGCALLEETGGVSCWDRSERAATFPGEAQAVAGLSGATALAVGDQHACAVLGDHGVVCWGDDDAGQLGNGAAGATHAAPVAVVRAP